MKQAFGTGRGCYEMFAKEDNPWFFKITSRFTFATTEN
jgi:hypothetical protein